MKKLLIFNIFWFLLLIIFDNTFAQSITGEWINTKENNKYYIFYEDGTGKTNYSGWLQSNEIQIRYKFFDDNNEPKLLIERIVNENKSNADTYNYVLQETKLTLVTKDGKIFRFIRK